MRLVLQDAGVIFDSLGQAAVDNAVPADQRPGSTAARDGWNNIYRNQLPNIVTGKQKIPNLTEITGNLFTDYEFTRPFLKGLRVGGGLNYRGKKVLGFRGADTIRNPALPNNAAAAVDDPNVDAYTAVYSEPYVTATGTLSYTFRLREKRRLQVQLRVANVFDDDTAIYTTTLVQRAPDGRYDLTGARVATPVNFRYQTPRSYLLTTTLSF